MILLSLGGADGPVGTPLVADLADLTDFLTPPTGALTVVPVAFAGLWGRRPRFAFRRVLRISSRDWSSLPDILEEEIVDRDGERIADNVYWSIRCLNRFGERVKWSLEGNAAGVKSQLRMKCAWRLREKGA
jgi:hypothetical protein